MEPAYDAASVNVRLRQDIAWREIDGEIVLLDLAGSAYYSVGHAGVVLWPSVVEGATVAQLTDVLVERFRLEPQQAERDVRDFLEALGEEGLLEGR